MRKTIMLLMLLVMALFTASSCTPTVSQQEYDRVSNELSTINSQLESLKVKLAETEILKTKYEELTNQYDTVKSEYDTLQTKYRGLGGEYEELNKQYNTEKSKNDNLQAKYEELTTEFEDLSKKYDDIMEETAEIINEQDLEQAIFELVNEARKENGLDELLWGKYLYKYAKANSIDMAQKKQLEYSDYGAYQEVYRASGYTKTEIMAEAVLTIWKDTKRYEFVFLNSVMVYGAVAVYKSGEIFNITFISDYYK